MTVIVERAPRIAVQCSAAAADADADKSQK